MVNIKVILLFLILINKFIKTKTNFCDTQHKTNIIKFKSRNFKLHNNNYYFGNIYFRFKVYYDSELAFLHNDDRNKIKNYILNIMNSVHLTFNHPEIKKFANITTIVLAIEPIDENRVKFNKTTHEINSYMSEFCRWFSQRNSLKDQLISGILLSGYNLWSSRSGSGVQGLADESSGCMIEGNHRPCQIIEVRSLKSAWILAHEIGHSMGMDHDHGIDTCNKNDYIMSPTTGDAKTTWSECSLNEFKEYLQWLKQHYNCLEPGPRPYKIESFFSTNEHMPKYYMSVEEQCGITLGSGFKPYRSPDEPYQDICKNIWCFNQYMRIAIHPALEGTNCAPNHICSRGECIPI